MSNTEAGFTPFHQIIAAHAQNHPDNIAFREEERSLTWKELSAHVRQVARALISGGIAPREHVAILGYPSITYAECLFGIIAARACVVPLPVSAGAESLEMMLGDCDAKMVFVDPQADAAGREVVMRFASKQGIAVIRFGENGADGEEYSAWRDLANGPEWLPEAQPEDPFNIIYSSGTTGMPKGIVHLHGMRQRQAGRNGFGFSPASRTLLSTPMYSNTTIMPMISTVAHGGGSIIMRKFDAGRFLALASTHRATHTMLVPVQYKRILAHADFANTDLSAFELSQSTGAPLEASVKRDILNRWPGRFREVYGMTEGGPSFFLDANAHPDKLATVGKPGYGTEVLLLDEEGRAMEAKAGVEGEVVGRSPFMMAGYHNRPEATAEIRWFDSEGRMYHRSGDVGRFDADGFLTLLDRRKDVIISGGHNIYPADLEAVLARHADVQEATVIGIPSAQWGETPLALVVPKPGAQINPEALRDWVNVQVGKLQRLYAVELRGELPRSHLGKLSKKELRAPYWNKSSGV